MKRAFKSLIVFALLLGLLSGCSLGKADNDIYIIYTNDVHCAIDANIGYAGLKAYKKDVETQSKYVTLVDCGDAVQGDLIGTVSKGEYVIDIMNDVGYDYAAIGNHEFDYGIDQLGVLIGKANAVYLGANIQYTGSQQNKLAAVKPYAIKDYGGTKVAYIGISTPNTIISSVPSYFQEDNKYVYGFAGDSATEFYTTIQGYIDEVKKAGADYVVAMAHLGDDESASPFTSLELVANTSGINLVLDGHAHSTVPQRILKDKDGKQVIMSSTGTQLNAIGQAVITTNGHIITSLITNYDEKDADTETAINTIKDKYETSLAQVVASSDIALSITDDNGIRMIRTRELPLGDLCADAYRAISGADIAFVNGGGIRANLPAGDITYADVIKVHPYGNMLCMVETTGQDILDALEFSCRFTKKAYVEKGLAAGEFGGFEQVSGLKFTIDTSVASTVEVDEKGMFTGVKGARRVKDVMVLDGDNYVAIDPAKTYTLASHNYMIKSCGDGYTMFADDKLLIDEGMIDNQVLITYLTDYLNGSVSAKYETADGRITIK